MKTFPEMTHERASGCKNSMKIIFIVYFFEQQYSQERLISLQTITSIQINYMIPSNGIENISRLQLTHCPLGQVTWISNVLLSNLFSLWIFWISSSESAKGPGWWQVNIGSGNGLLPSGNTPLPAWGKLTQICVTIWHHKATMSWHLIYCWTQYVTWWRHQMETFSVLLTLCDGYPLVTGGVMTPVIMVLL